MRDLARAHGPVRCDERDSWGGCELESTGFALHLCWLASACGVLLGTRGGIVVGRSCFLGVQTRRKGRGHDDQGFRVRYSMCCEDTDNHLATNRIQFVVELNRVVMLGVPMLACLTSLEHDQRTWWIRSALKQPGNPTDVVLTIRRQTNTPNVNGGLVLKAFVSLVIRQTDHGLMLKIDFKLVHVHDELSQLGVFLLKTIGLVDHGSKRRRLNGDSARWLRMATRAQGDCAEQAARASMVELEETRDAHSYCESPDGPEI